MSAFLAGYTGTYEPRDPVLGRVPRRAESQPTPQWSASISVTCRICGGSFDCHPSRARTHCRRPECEREHKRQQSERSNAKSNAKRNAIRDSIHPLIPGGSEWAYQGRTVRVTSVMTYGLGIKVVVRTMPRSRPWTMTAKDLLANGRRLK